MPYQLVTAHVRSKDAARQWSEADLSAMPINRIFQTYSKIYLTLSNPSLAKPVYLDMEDARKSIGLSTIPRTIGQWLMSIGNATLPTVPVLPSFEPKFARYANIWVAGYSAKRVALGRNPDSEINEGDKFDLLLTKPGLEPLQYGRSLLATVNGFFHRIYAADDGFYIVDGGRSTMIANDNRIGLHDFRDVGAIDVVPITMEMVYKTALDQRLGQYAYIKLPYDVSRKTVGIVIGGYLHLLDTTYRVSGDRTLRVDFNNLSLAERLFASGQAINLKPLMLESSEGNELKRSVEDLYSDKTIRAYLTLPQSFLVIFDADSMYVRRHPLENMQFPGRYMGRWPEQRYPLFSALGQCLDYQAFPRDDRCMYATQSARVDRYNFATWEWRDRPAIDQTRYSAAPFHFADAHLLEIGRT